MKKNHKMNCKEINEMLIFYADNSLPEEKSSEIEHHLSQCRECSSFLGFLKDSLGHINKEKEFESDTFLYSRIISLKTSRTNHSGSRVISVLPRLAAAAVIAAAIAGGALIGRLYSSSPADLNTLMSEETKLFDDIKQEPLESFLLTLNEQ